MLRQTGQPGAAAELGFRATTRAFEKNSGQGFVSRFLPSRWRCPAFVSDRICPCWSRCRSEGPDGRAACRYMPAFWGALEGPAHLVSLRSSGPVRWLRSQEDRTERTVKHIRGPILEGRTRSEDREQKAGRPLLGAVQPPEHGSKIAGQQENQPECSRTRGRKRTWERLHASGSKETEDIIG